MKERVDYYDILRGVAIMAVIAIHTTGNMKHLDDTSKMSFHLAVIWRQVVGFAVPLFLAVSGYFLSQKPADNWSRYLNFLFKQVPRVYFPMLIWSIPFLLLALYFNNNVSHSIILFLVGGFSIYYFIALIIQYYILLPYLQRMANKRGLILASLISSISLGIFFYLWLFRFDLCQGFRSS
jgi:surface polysaccharide O-acyltransferase-like enzyme